jgi:carbon-monoxide dehydrogenase small subunit
MPIKLRVNGHEFEVEAPPLRPLAVVLREQLDMRGTKIGCGNGDCGACTVLVGDTAVCSCLYPVFRAEGTDVTTIEGLERDGTLTRLQQAFIDYGATQCGFCTAGMLMSATALLARYAHPTEEDIIHGMTGNICRCTGYRAIIEAISSVAAEALP